MAAGGFGSLQQIGPTDPIFNRSVGITPTDGVLNVDSPEPDADWKPPQYPKIKCPKERLVKGVCEAHEHTRWYLVPCKARDCEVCGPLGRQRLAARINYGIKMLGSCWYVVLTFATSKACEPAFKSSAVRRVGRFLGWLRKRLGFHFEYSLTWELQPKSGRLHCNVVFNYAGERLPYSEMISKWGAFIRCRRVYDSKRLGEYVTKCSGDDVPEGGLGSYVTKAGYQAVPREWGRRVSFSKGWPRREKVKYKGSIVWLWCDSADRIEFFSTQFDDYLVEEKPGEWVGRFDACDCFDVLDSGKCGAILGSG